MAAMQAWSVVAIRCHDAAFERKFMHQVARQRCLSLAIACLLCNVPASPPRTRKPS